MKNIVITGGPGSGKSSLIKELESRGLSCSHEVSRELIIEEAAKVNGCLPWLNLPEFAELVLDRMKSRFEEARDNPTFFDRGIPDIIAYLKAADLEVPSHYYKAVAAHPYHTQVFILPPWGEIYVNDSERWQSFAEAETLYQHIQQTYREGGYELIEVPKLGFKERADFLLRALSLVGESDKV
jgi:predicted ATPase